MPWQWQKDAEAWNTKVWVEPTWKGKAKGKGKDQYQTDKGKGKGKGNGGASGSGDVGKGKGKDAGKGKGKGKGAWWPCPDARCATMVGKVWMNPPADCQCSQCHTYRAAAPALWEDQRSVLREKIAAEQEAAGKGTPPKEEDGGPAVMEVSEEEEEEESALELTEEYLEVESKLFEPKELRAGWDPEMELQTGPAGAKGCSNQLEKEIESCKKLIALEPMAAALGSKVDFPAARAKLAALEKSAAKAKKDAPGAALTACQLAVVRQEYVEAEEKKVKFAEAGAAKAILRQDRLEEICSQQATLWMDQLRAVEKRKLVRDAAWEVRSRELASRRTQALEMIGLKIKAANTLAGAMKGALTAEEEKAKSAKEKAAEAKAAQAAKEGKEAEAKKTEHAKARLAAVEAFKQLDLTAVVAKEDLPDLTEAPEAAKSAVVVLSTMFCWARASALGESHLPFAFSEMGATAVVAKCLTGDVVWDAFFKGAAVTDGTICPMQLRQIVFRQLMQYESSLKIKKQAEQEREATRILEDAEPRLKRLRTLVKGGTC